MYTILVNNNNELIPSITERIMQRSSGVNTIRFLMSPTYNGINISECTVLLEYALPISREPKSVILTVSEDLYKDNLEYLFPLTIDHTKESGKLEMHLSFFKTDMTANGEVTSCVRKTDPVFIDVLPVTAWSNMIPDSEFAAIDQRILKLSAIANQLNDTQNIIADNRADNIKLDMDNKNLYLTNDGKQLGDPISLNDLGDAISENTKDGLLYVMTDEEESESEYSISVNEDGTITLLVNGEKTKTVTAEELNELFSKENVNGQQGDVIHDK